MLDPEEARLIDALDGLAAAMEGRNVDAMFADLVGREPELPEHSLQGLLRTEVPTAERISCPRPSSAP